ncbi:MAG: hypothetical protein ACXWVI_06595 [Methyloceanibacter sp.]
MEHAAALPQYGAVKLGFWPTPLLRNYIDTKSFALDISGIAAGTGFALLMAIAILPRLQKLLRSRQANSDPTLRAVRLRTRLAILVPGWGNGDPVERCCKLGGLTRKFA